MIYRSAIAACIGATAFASSAAYAACTSGEPVFLCTTTNGKTVEVCDSGKVIEYTFGKKGTKPEMALSIPRADATTFQWDGFGRYITYSVQIPNGDTVYEVFSSFDRMDDEHEATAGINVDVDGQHVATLTCKAETVIDNMEGISLRSASWQ